jgi:thiol-disulfide isomerase/thioredoxin
MMKQTLLIVAAMGLAACDAGDKGLPAEPQADATPEAQAQATSAPAALNAIDRAFAGSEAPDVRLELPGEGETTLRAAIAGADGKRVLVNLWATWCPPCLAEMPALDALAGDARGALMVLPVSQDMEGWQAVDGFFEAGKFSVLTPVLDQPGSLGEALEARGLPMTVLYGPDGKEIWRVSGTPDWASDAVRGDVLS